MAGAEYYTDQNLAIYRRVPPAGPGVCRVCHSGPNEGYSICHSCHTTMSQVSRPVTSVLPISLYELTGQYWHVLRRYKDDRRPDVRAQLSTVLAATIARFTSRHWACIAELLRGQPTIATTVPSSRTPARTDPHPLVAIVQRCSHLGPLHQALLTRGPGQIGHRQASNDGFTTRHDLRGHRVLLIEDTFTTGARAQSAGSALYLAGASAVAVVTAGRVVDPQWNDNCQKIWRYAAASTFSFDECAAGTHS
jgi:predicted amidophosphoribosyltransferase